MLSFYLDSEWSDENSLIYTTMNFFFMCVYTTSGRKNILTFNFDGVYGRKLDIVDVFERFYFNV